MKTKIYIFFGIITILLLGTTIIKAETITQTTSTSGYTTNTTSPTTTTTSGTTNTTSPTTTTINTTISLLEMRIFPQTTTIYIGNKTQFKAGTNTKIFDGVTWSVAESNGGAIDPSGTYTPPSTSGMYHIIARLNGYRVAYASVVVIPPPLEELPNTNNTSITPSVPTIPNQPIINPVVTPIQFTSTTRPQFESIKTPLPTDTRNTKATQPSEPGNVLPISSTTRTIRTTSEYATGKISTTTHAEIQKNIRIGDLTSTLRVVNTNFQENKKDLLRVIDDRIALVTTNTDLPNQAEKLEQLKNLREKIDAKLESNITKSASFTKTSADNLTTTVKEDLRNIDNLVKTINPKLPEGVSPLENTKTIETIAKTIVDQSEILKNQDADLLYKDSNKDGVSDYDSVHIYNLDPIKPSPVSTFEGKQITAKDKIILGFDPTKPELEKINHEEPFTVLVPIASTYTVDEVKLDENKNVTLKGQALPNSFITIYIFSTPIIVTVKTDENGDWQYTLNKEIENGEHMIYTASVDNSGKILTRSTVFPFVKTAQAATLDTNLSKPDTTSKKPSFFDLDTILIIFIVFIILVSSAIYMIGQAYKARVVESESSNIPPNPPPSIQQ